MLRILTFSLRFLTPLTKCPQFLVLYFQFIFCDFLEQVTQEQSKSKLPTKAGWTSLRVGGHVMQFYRVGQKSFQ